MKFKQQWVRPYFVRSNMAAVSSVTWQILLQWRHVKTLYWLSLLHRLYCARSLPTNSLWATTWNDVSDSLKLPAHLMLGESALTSHCSQINVNAGREWPRPLHVNKPTCSLMLFANRGAGLKLWRIFKSRLYEQNEIVWLNSISCVQVKYVSTYP